MKQTMINTSLRVAGWLLWQDLHILFKDWKNQILNTLSWPTVQILISGYILPAMGMPGDYGAFCAVGVLIVNASFMAWGRASVIAADLDGSRSIAYELTLPVTYQLVYLKHVLFIACRSAIFSFASILVAKLLLFSTFDLSHASFFKFVVIYLISTFFFGLFTMWAAMSAGSVDRVFQIERRLAGPLFFVCGYTFPWQTLYAVSPTVSYCMLASPWIYIYEGTRAAILGQDGFISYWACVGALLVFCVVLGLHGLSVFKKRLDCV